MLPAMLSRNLLIACTSEAARHQSAFLNGTLQCLSSQCLEYTSGSWEKQFIGGLSHEPQSSAHSSGAFRTSSTPLPVSASVQFSHQAVSVQPTVTESLQWRRHLSTQPAGNTQPSPSHTKCWHCQQPIGRGSSICEHCNTLQPVDPTLTHFETLGM
jgi:hypothetical protein